MRRIDLLLSLISRLESREKEEEKSGVLAWRGRRVAVLGAGKSENVVMLVVYRATSLLRNCALLGPYSRTMPRATLQ